MSTMESFAQTRGRAGRILRRLGELYPDARCSLDFQTPLQLLIATILSAQCTDKRVNLVTPALFAAFPDVSAFAAADVGTVETLIQSTGFFRTKARNIVDCCRIVLADYGGAIPGRLDDLVRLPGVGRKTANVLLGNAFDIPGITVDTHVGRLSRRLGLTLVTDPVKVEQDLMQLIPRPQWTIFSHRLIFHGRQVCQARSPDCDQCKLRRLCPRVGVVD